MFDNLLKDIQTISAAVKAPSFDSIAEALSAAADITKEAKDIFAAFFPAAQGMHALPEGRFPWWRFLPYPIPYYPVPVPVPVPTPVMGAKDCPDISCEPCYPVTSLTWVKECDDWCATNQTKGMHAVDAKKIPWTAIFQLLQTLYAMLFPPTPAPVPA